MPPCPSCPRLSDIPWNQTSYRMGKKTVPKKAGFKQLTKHDMTYNVHIEREEQKCVFHLKDLAKHVKTSIPTEKYPV